MPELTPTPMPAPKAGKELENAKPFLWTASGWAAFSVAICAFFPPRHGELKAAIVWFVVIWAISLLDLAALARLLDAVLALAAGPAEMRGRSQTLLIIQSFYWGLIKLACLGLLGAILFRASVVPASGLLLGLATLIVVPIVGGFIWGQATSENHGSAQGSQRSMYHA